MPLDEAELPELKQRVFNVFMDSITILRTCAEVANVIFRDRAQEIRDAILECLTDFVDNPEAAGQMSPRTAIFEASAASFEAEGFYGAQWNLKESQLTRAVQQLGRLFGNPIRAVRSVTFKQWATWFNNFLKSLAKATGIGGAIEELKDCLVGELEDTPRRLGEPPEEFVV